MSTFTSILQQRINALENQIRNLQEQNNNLRRRARYLMEAAPSADMSMLPVADASQVPDQVGPSGIYGGNPDRYTNLTATYEPRTLPGQDGINRLPLGHDLRKFLREASRQSDGSYRQLMNDGSYRYYYPNPPFYPAQYVVTDENGNITRNFRWYDGRWNKTDESPSRIQE